MLFNDLFLLKIMFLVFNLLGLIFILLFVVLVVVIGLFINDIMVMFILVVFFISVGYGLCLNLKGKKEIFVDKV